MNRHNFSSWNHRIIQFSELEGIEIEGLQLNTVSKLLLIASYYLIITYRLLQLKIPVEWVQLILIFPLKLWDKVTCIFSSLSSLFKKLISRKVTCQTKKRIKITLSILTVSS